MHPDVGQYLYRCGGGTASHRGTLRLEPHAVATPTHVWHALKPTCQVGVILDGLAENCLPSYYYPYDRVKQSMKMIGV